MIKFKRLNTFIILSFFTFLGGCNNIGTAEFEGSLSPGNINVDESLVFSGLTSVTDKTDSSLTLHWTPHPDAVAYEIYDSSSLVTTVMGQGSDHLNLSELTPSKTYRFRVLMKTSEGMYDNNSAISIVTMSAAPAAPSSLSLSSPNLSPSTVASPVIRVEGVKAGDTVRLYVDSNCSTIMPIQGDGKVQDGLNHIEITLTSLSPNSYNVYARAIGIASNASQCSVASIAYTRLQCPENYIYVPHDMNVGTAQDFCVAKYEMKDVSGTATSQMSGAPWVHINPVDAKLKCEALNALNGEVSKYGLISNEEWMTIARNVEQVDDNWSPLSGNQVPGSGVLARGHSDNNPGSSLAASTDDNPYSGTGNSSAQSANSGWEQRRTLTLSNGQIIWDFSGNVYEWVDWQVSPAKKAHPFGISPSEAWRQWNTVDTLIGENLDDEMHPHKWASLFVRDINGNLLPGPIDNSNGIGAYWAGNNSSGGFAVRSGAWDTGMDAGAFLLALSNDSTSSSMNDGFRCVYRP